MQVSNLGDSFVVSSHLSTDLPFPGVSRPDEVGSVSSDRTGLFGLAFGGSERTEEGERRGRSFDDKSAGGVKEERARGEVRRVEGQGRVGI